MAISKNITITIRSTKATPSEKLFIYQGDFGIDFYFKLNEFNYSIKNTINLASNLDEGAYASVTVQCPNGDIFERDPFPIENDLLKFTITKDLTDDLSDIGKYTLQFHLYDGEGSDANRITIPPISFEIRTLLI